MKKIVTLFFLFSFIFLNAQERIDGTLPFQSDPAKKYSIFIPTNYDANTPSKMMLALHPLNTNRWDSESWCDTLIAFADANDLLMICPDGGADGAVDDQIDTAFTSVILDSMMIWYNVDPAKVWVMGFSWGGRTTYSYGLRRPEKFAGFLPIGSAITGTDQVDGFLENAQNKPFYIVHGSNDNPNVRFTPMVNALNDNGACVETNLLSGVGHTIDFPNRNAILTTAFEWLESVECAPNSIDSLSELETPNLYPNPVSQGEIVNLKNWKDVTVYSITGKVDVSIIDEKLSTNILPKGVYFVNGNVGGTWVTRQLLVL